MIQSCTCFAKVILLPNKGDWIGRAPEGEEGLKCNESAKSLGFPKISGCPKAEFLFLH